MGNLVIEEFRIIMGHTSAPAHQLPIYQISNPGSSQSHVNVKINTFMSLSKRQALEMFQSDDLIGIGMEADALRRKLHPEGVVTYIIDRNINYTNFCPEYCTFCPFYAPVTGTARSRGY